jgi:hypothetical protein
MNPLSEVYLRLQADGKARFNDRSEQKKNRAEFTAYGRLSIRSSGLLDDMSPTQLRKQAIMKIYS